MYLATVTAVSFGQLSDQRFRSSSNCDEKNLNGKRLHTVVTRTVTEADGSGQSESTKSIMTKSCIFRRIPPPQHAPDLCIYIPDQVNIV